MRDIEASPPFALPRIDCNNGGELIKDDVVAWTLRRPKPVLFTCWRPYRNRDTILIEQRNWTHVRQHFDYDRYDNPPAGPLINTLCKGAPGQLLHHFLPTQERKGSRTVRPCGNFHTHLARLLAALEVTKDKKLKAAAT